ncbi:MAG: TlpA disulfide reductase family protein [Candidatus Lernaella stagnicola]|nr:TlpA disulfide reductase family protein [Candidatus Lernaella stagnicola]
MSEPSGKANPWYADFRMYLLIFIVLTVFMLKAVFSGSPTASCGTPSVAADFRVAGLDGKEVHLSDLKGKVVFLNFWATWCKPCIRELPSIQNLQKRYGARDDFAIVAVSVDEGPTKELKDFLDGFNRRTAVEPLSFPVFHDPKGETAAAYHVSGFPTTFLIDRDGQIHRRFIGPRHWGDKHFLAMLDELLAAPTQ